MFIIWAPNIESATPTSKTLLKCVSCTVVSSGEVRLADIASLTQFNSQFNSDHEHNLSVNISGEL